MKNDYRNNSRENYDFYHNIIIMIIVEYYSIMIKNDIMINNDKSLIIPFFIVF